MYNQYEISQIQRRYEREIRSAKREQVAFKVAVQEAKDPDLKQVMQDSLNYSNSLVKDKQAKMRDFIKQTGQDRDYFREQNYGRVDYKKNTQNNLTFSQNSGNIEESRKNKHTQPINDISIRKVKALNGGAYSDEQNKIIQAKHKELLVFRKAWTCRVILNRFHFR